MADRDNYEEVLGLTRAELVGERLIIPARSSGWYPANPDLFYFPAPTNHSITFGDGHLYPPEHEKAGDFMGINTWDDWHLIPASRPTVAQAGVSLKMVDIPGRALGPIDMTEYLTGRPVYTARSGSFSFIVANDYEYWENIRLKIVDTLHGKTMKMCLADDPDWCYGGRFTFNEWRSESWNSSVVIDYVLSPYKFPISYDELWKWDPFNFDTDQTDLVRNGRL